VTPVEGEIKERLVGVRDESDDESADDEPEDGNEKSGEGWESMDED
jgi:periodic tryptophan protein 1